MFGHLICLLFVVGVNLLVVLLQLLSGQRLSFWKKKSTFLTVDIQTYGIKHDNARMKPATVRGRYTHMLPYLNIHL